MERLLATNVFFELLKLTVRVLISDVSCLGDRLRNMHLYFELYSQSKQDRPTKFFAHLLLRAEITVLPNLFPASTEYTATSFT